MANSTTIDRQDGSIEQSPRDMPGPKPLRLTIILACLLAFASISTDLFLPALPAMGEALGAGEGTLNLTISSYLLGFGFGQLFWGPISDRFGRKGPITIGVAVFILGSAGCALSTSAEQIIGWRVVQALGASASVVLARAMVRDLYDRDDAARRLSTLMTVMAIAPLVGPSIGAQIMALASWRAIFWVLVAFGILTAFAVATLPESLPGTHRQSASLKSVASGYRDLLRNRVLFAHSGAIGFFYAGIFATIAGAPFAFISYHGLSPDLYGIVFASGIIGLMAANTANARLVLRLGSERMLLIGVSGASIAGLLAVVVALMDLGGATGLAAALFVFTACNGFILANAVAGALSSVQTRAGAAAALVGAFQYGGGMVGAAMVSALANETPVAMAIVMAIGGVGSLLCLLVARRRRSL